MIKIIKELALVSPFVVCLFSSISLYIRFGKEDKAKLVMSIFMLSATIYYFINILKQSGQSEIYSWVHPLNLFLQLIACPQAYFYVRALTTGKTKDRYFIYHFLPAIVYLVFGILFYFQMPEGERVSFAFRQQLSIWQDKSIYGVNMVLTSVFSKIFIVQVIAYMIAGRMLLARHRKELNDVFSDFSGYKLNWVKYFLWIMFFWAFAGEIGSNRNIVVLADNGWVMYLADFIMCVVVLSTYLLASMQSSIVYTRQETNPETEPLDKFNHYKLKDKLVKAFEEKELFLKKDLTIWDLCREVNSNRTYISNLINDHFQMNFNCFVNQYRVKKAKALMADNSNNHLGFEKIAQLSGFNSITSFIRAFQKFENTSPGNYRKMVFKSEI